MSADHRLLSCSLLLVSVLVAPLGCDGSSNPAKALVSDGGGADVLSDAGTPMDDAGPAVDAAADAHTDATPSSEAAASLCERICAITSMTSCPPPGACVPGCEQSLTEPCNAELRVLLTCEAAGRPEDYSCDGRGRLTLHAGLCDDEESALVDCLTNAE